MKKNIWIKAMAGVLLAGGMGSCASDYLDLQPETALDASVVHTTIKGAESAMIGAYRSMWCIYSNWGMNQRFVQGEAWYQYFYGDVMGTDAYYNVWDTGVYRDGLMKWTTMNDKTTWISNEAWAYPYNLINQCNEILSGIDTMEDGTPERRAAVKAQALSLRAHSYWRLLQQFAPRWVDAKNGDVYVCVLRLTPGTENAPLAKMSEVLDQLYADLDLALELFDETGFRRSENYEINKQVAQGIYARVAMLKNDWQKAYDMASAARASFPIMSADEYKGGFAEPNGEWMWNNAFEDYNIGYWSWGAINACNGAYVAFWGQGAGAINYDLYRWLDTNDVRAGLYFTPKSAPLRHPIRESSFWNENLCSPVTMNLYSNVNMQNIIKNFGSTKVPAGGESKWGYPYTVAGDAEQGTVMLVPFGAQYKFWGLGTYSISCFPFMRGAEMLLYQAEAAYRLGKEGEVQSLLTELNSKRLAGYTCTKTGDELWQELMMTSRNELWGEGHMWGNAKRWNVPMVRRAWVAGDVTSNNMPSSIAINKQPSDNFGWVYAIPRSELQFNLGIDQSQLIVSATYVPEGSGSEEEEEEETPAE